MPHRREERGEGREGERREERGERREGEREEIGERREGDCKKKANYKYHNIIMK